MKVQSLLAGGAFAVALIGLAGASNAQAAARTGQDCFFSSTWSGWKAPDDKTLLLRIGVRDVFRVDLQGETSQLHDPGARLVNVIRGSNSICSPLDLDLKVTSDSGFSVPLIATAITRLTPDQVAAIPKRDQP